MRLASPTGLSPSLAPRSRGLRLPARIASVGPTTPWRPKAPRFGLIPFRSPLLRESRLISLPQGTEMFQFPWFAPFRVTVIAHRRVAPFGHPRIAGCVLLPLAYRSLPRPSSPSCAQASPTCFRSLDHKIVSKQSTRDLLDRVFNVIQHLALDSFPTITTYEQLSNSEISFARAALEAFLSTSRATEKLSTEHRSPGTTQPD